MALNYLKTRLKNRIDTAANWTSANPTLLQGEIGIESDTGYAKAGDGSTAWNNLGYLSAPGLTDCITTETLTETLGDYALKDDLSGYATLTGANSFTGANTFESYVRCNADLETASDNVLVTKGYVNEAIAGIDIDTSNLVDLSSTQTITGAKTFGDATFTGTVNMLSGAVYVSTPAVNTQAANKQYVDDAVSNISTTGNYLPLSGGTMTGAITLADVNNSLALNKTSTSGNGISISMGSNATGNALNITSSDSTKSLIFTQGGYVNLQNSSYVTVPTPTASMHATTKTYVDEAIEEALNTQVADMSNVDLNTYTTTGDYFVSSSSSLTNAPSGNSSSALQNVFLNVVAYNTSNLTQTLTCVPSNNSNTVYRYVRLCAGGTWKDWQQVAPPAVDSSTIDELSSNVSTLQSNVSTLTSTTTNLWSDLEGVKEKGMIGEVVTTFNDGQSNAADRCGYIKFTNGIVYEWHYIDFPYNADTFTVNTAFTIKKGLYAAVNDVAYSDTDSSVTTNAYLALCNYAQFMAGGVSTVKVVKSSNIGVDMLSGTDGQMMLLIYQTDD